MPAVNEASINNNTANNELNFFIVLDLSGLSCFYNPQK
jgi:hypothetical protein